MFNPRNYFDRQITKEQYDRAIENDGFLTTGDADSVLTVAERCGYGATAGIVRECDGKYLVSCHMYDSCD